MPEPTGFFLTPEFADDVAEAVAWFKQQSRNPPQPSSGPARRPTDINHQYLVVNDATQSAVVNGVTYYLATLQRWDVPTGDYVDLLSDDTATVAIFFDDGTVPNDGDEFYCRQWGNVTGTFPDDDDDTTYPAFTPVGTPGTQVVRIRIVGLPIQDSVTKWWYYPGIIQKPFDPTALWADTDTSGFPMIDPSCLNDPGQTLGTGGLGSSPTAFNCWVVFWDTVIDAAGVDGTWSTAAIPAGKTFDPTGGDSGDLDYSAPCSTPENTDFSAPVYEGFNLARGIAGQCIVNEDGPDTTLNLR